MFTLTESAAEKVKGLLAEETEGDMRLRVAVRPGGCSGFSYEMFFDAEIAGDDTLLEVHGAPVVIDRASSQLLDSATLDYRDGLQDAGFKITNPAAQRTCGCGQSFS
jgi:iron-sulfur cluster assembly protein/iron-sulfur cluster insertion protein